MVAPLGVVLVSEKNQELTITLTVWALNIEK